MANLTEILIVDSDMNTVLMLTLLNRNYSNDSVPSSPSEYVAELKESVVHIIEGIETSVLVRTTAPQSLSSDFEHPDKQSAVNALKSRFKK